jgi:hypothetical protein
MKTWLLPGLVSTIHRRGLKQFLDRGKCNACGEKQLEEMELEAVSYQPGERV